VLIEPVAQGARWALNRRGIPRISGARMARVPIGWARITGTRITGTGISGVRRGVAERRALRGVGLRPALGSHGRLTLVPRPGGLGPIGLRPGRLRRGRAGVLAVSPGRRHTKKDSCRSHSHATDPSRIVCFSQHSFSVSACFPTFRQKREGRGAPIPVTVKMLQSPLSLLLEIASNWSSSWALFSMVCRSCTTAACPGATGGCSQSVMPR